MKPTFCDICNCIIYDAIEENRNITWSKSKYGETKHTDKDDCIQALKEKVGRMEDQIETFELGYRGFP